MTEPVISAVETVIDNGKFGTRTVKFETGLLARQAAGLGRSMRVRVSADGYDVVCRLAQEGLGIGIVAESSFRLFGIGMDVISLPVLDSWARRQHRVCVRSLEALSPAARLLLDSLLQGHGHPS